MQPANPREFWIMPNVGEFVDFSDILPDAESFTPEEGDIHVIEYEGPRGYKSLVEAHDFQVKLNKELQNLLKQCESKISELESTREKLRIAVESLENCRMQFADMMSRVKAPDAWRIQELDEALAKVKEMG